MSDGVKIGEINGKWSILFKWLLALNAILIPPIIGWATWLTMTVISMNYDLKLRTLDRFTGSMFIEVQSELRKKNPNMTWLSPSEIKDIQRNNIPYNH